MKLNDTTSLGYKIAELLYKNGPMFAADIAAALPEHHPKGVGAKIGRMCFEADLERTEEGIQLRLHLRHHFSQKHAVPGECAAPRHFNVNRPLSKANMGWLVHAGRYRDDVSFLTCSKAA